jgi:group II intron reverse transcriptase/maturase
MIFGTTTRTQDITKEQVWTAWKRVRRGGAGTGIDGISKTEIDIHPHKYLYPLWNRLSSGSYYPPAVREVSIPKGNGKERLLGIPTIMDRVAQEVIRAELEPILEPQFLPSSYGYRPNKNAHDALAACAQNSWERWYVVDVDIKGFFDNINHIKLMDILRQYTQQKHILLYCERWLNASIQKRDGTLINRENGTPQGGVISPLLANLYLHEVFDKWMLENYSNMVYERYADDIVIHTRSIAQSRFIYDKLGSRLRSYSLEINTEKSKIVYCYRTSRFHKEGREVPVSFDYLGYTFKPRVCSRTDGQRFVGFRPGISTKSQTRIKSEIRSMHILQSHEQDIHQIAQVLNPKVRGWIRYYGRFRPSALSGLFTDLNYQLTRWVRNKYKLTSYRKAKRWLQRVISSYTYLFVHWEYGYVNI